ncbi:hypothetical protein MOO44_08410 [Nicoliella spurrieriana]|uniref:Uncharacterized protein n=1 Tax=Nicoliella spurrieriana TaxID=2925830 RepID=A0A976RSN7_9LACO|nr:hypothetical protein [Nicoliella spurrieriana]UQS86871.1 hypothetical protein MOO44_08410 [Nicoliella spurrieriana]
MIHRRVFRDLHFNIQFNPDLVNQYLKTFFMENGQMMDSMVNLQKSNPQVVVDLWWLKKLANQNAIAADSDLAASTLSRLDSIEAEYWVNFQTSLKTHYLIPEAEFSNALNAWKQVVAQDGSYERDVQTLKQFWDAHRDALAFIMDNDDVFMLLDYFFQHRHDFSKDAMNQKTASLIERSFNQLILRYSVRKEVLTRL